MPRLLTVLGLQCYALVLAWVRSLGGIRTDEAKYLLDIPYPHPPALRWVFSQAETWAAQDWFWRVVLASLTVQAAWLVWDLARDQPRRRQIVIAGAWLLSGGVLLQAGSVMMVVATALQLLAFLWLRSRPEVAARNQGAVALLWLFSLFTAYQALLFLPMAVSTFRRSGVSAGRTAFYVAVPVLLLALYTLTNPLVPASMLAHAGRQIAETPFDRVLSSLRVWAIAGSGIASVAGTWGLLRSRDLPALASFLLVAAYVVLSRYDYYAILFLPLLVSGLRSLSALPRPRMALPSLALCSAVLVWLVPPLPWIAFWAVTGLSLYGLDRLYDDRQPA